MSTLRYSNAGRFIKCLVVGFYVVGATALFGALRELPLISIDVDNGITTNTVHTGVGALAPAAGTAKPPKAGKNTVQDAQSQLIYTISLRNLSSFPANGLTLEYHFYNKTTANNAGVSTITVEDVTNTQTLDLPVNGKMDVKTTPINHDVKQTYSQSTGTSGGTNSAGTKKKGGSMTLSSGQTDVTTTRVMGYVIVLKSGSTIVKTLLSSDDIVDQVRTIQAKMASGQ